ncbi:hypothetical protein BH11MYX3_BH11MYX3_27900 [soil metagenome]
MRLAVFSLVLLSSACSQKQAPGPRIELVEAPATGVIATYVAQEVARGAQDHVPVLVYVGATWCEPCREFHDAAAAGSLDAALAPVRFLVFDLDRDGERLATAGYRSELVPLFARPGADGRASGTQTDGVKQGGAYLEQLVPRIRALAGR